MKLKNVKLKLTGGVYGKHNTKQAIIKVARYSTTKSRIAKKPRG
jgi:hypothetical protein